MLQPGYIPSDTVIIQAESLAGLEPVLDDADGIALAKAPSQEDIRLLKAYADKGGKILPDIFAGESRISEEQIAAMFQGLNASSIKGVPLRYLSDSRAAVSLNATGKFLVLSEQFSQYPGWKAMLGGQELPLLQASTILTAVHLRGKTGEVTFEYHPSSVKNGLLIGAATLLAMLLALVVWYTQQRKKGALPSSPSAG